MSKYQQLTQDERYRITALLMEKHSQSQIAQALGRADSTISRELKRNRTTHDGFYRAEKAQSYAQARRKRCRRKPHFSPEQFQTVATLLQRKYSPVQICGELKNSGSFSISHETIYRYILKDKRAGGSLYKHTRIMSKYGRKRYKSKDSRGVLPGKRHISERPPEAESRLEPGHWEGDTVIGKDKRHCVLTLVERRSGYAIIRKLSSRTMAEVTREAKIAIEQHRHQFKTITFDNGTEFHDYAALEQRFNTLKCYFATPYHSWERGSNENLNGLFRQYVPKHQCMSTLTQEHCNEIAHCLNTRPRKRHQFRTPSEVFDAS